MGVSPRSRWSNRDDRSYQVETSNESKIRRQKTHTWIGISGDFTAPYLIIGQFTSIAAIIMLISGTNSNGIEHDSSNFWILNSASLTATALIGAVSAFSLLLVLFSRSASRNRKRIARIWLIAFLIITYRVLGH